ncbi:hypothetical protein BCR43DRAFT_500399 [Syncephalastrum racemosum]|uniref:Uncharacterized protein n=1 Tax=Syncephalastrum racemosum TaxID=13706 RepID=A0A1X2HS85_SYNRA|nr:hypothetical protein BCR43DRAFT_500399 [Syncephalastrum racemosum]
MALYDIRERQYSQEKKSMTRLLRLKAEIHSIKLLDKSIERSAQRMLTFIRGNLRPCGDEDSNMSSMAGHPASIGQYPTDRDDDNWKQKAERCGGGRSSSSNSNSNSSGDGGNGAGLKVLRYGKGHGESVSKM